MSQYASAQDFYDLAGLSKERLENGPKPVYADTLDKMLRAASEMLDAAIAIKYAGSVPLVSWGESVRLHVIQIAAYYVSLRIGMNPAGDGLTFKSAHDAALLWLRDIREGKQFLPGLTAIVVKSDYRGAAFGGPAVDGDSALCERGGRRNFWGHGCG